MQCSLERIESRREFFRTGARWGALALVAVLAGLTARSRRLQGQQCVNLGICRGCGSFTTCGLPAALSARQAGKGS
jgi:hypothetical protein